MTMTMHIHRPRPKIPRLPAVAATKVTKPYRAEHPKKKVISAWRDNVEEAFEDARRLGAGARVVSKEKILLATFDNVYLAPEPRRKRAVSPDEEDE